MDFSSSFSDLSLVDISLICRGCLASTGEMKNMIEWGLAEDFHKVANIQVNASDDITLLLCTACEESLYQSLKFKTQCSQSNTLLKSTKNKNERPNSDEKVNTIEYVLQKDKMVIIIMAPDMGEKIRLPCPYCSTKHFLKKPDLISHIFNEHNLKYSVEIKYHCSETNCAYHLKSKQEKYFTGRKFLNQHINKVHNNKHIHCETCSKKFPTESDFRRHLKTCNFLYICQPCNIQYETNERLLVHLKRRHPELHKEYKERKAEKRKASAILEKKDDMEIDKLQFCDSPKRSFATQTFENIKNDVTFWQGTKKDEISTQTVFEDLLSLKSQTSEDDSIFFSETVSLSDIQTQTIPFEFGLSRSNKETVTSQTQSPDFSIKETQTCFCHFDSPKRRFENASPLSMLTSTETQTLDRTDTEHDALSCTAETQTSFENDLNKDL